MDRVRAHPTVEIVGFTIDGGTTRMRERDFVQAWVADGMLWILRPDGSIIGWPVSDVLSATAVRV